MMPAAVFCLLFGKQEQQATTFSQEQQNLIVEHYFFSRSYAYVVDEFHGKYPGVAVPNNSTIMRLITHFRECKSVEENVYQARREPEDRPF